MAKKRKKLKTGPTAQAGPGQKENGAVRRPVSPLFRLALLFGLYMAVFHIILYIVEPTFAPPMQRGITKVVGLLLTGTGVTNAAYPDAFRIVLTHDTWIIDVGCTAIGAMILFCAFILAYTSSAGAKLTGIVCGIPFIAMLNIIRLVVLGWITELFPGVARQFHDYVWQTIFLFIVVAMWFIWIEQVVKREKNPAVAR